MLTHGNKLLKLETPNDTGMSGTMLMYQTMLMSSWDLHYNMHSADAPEQLKIISPTHEEYEMMTEAGALLSSMNIQTNTAHAVAVSPLLVCSTQSNLPSDGSDFVMEYFSHCPPWNGITTLHKDIPDELQMKDVVKLKEMSGKKVWMCLNMGSQGKYQDLTGRSLHGLVTGRPGLNRALKYAKTLNGTCVHLQARRVSFVQSAIENAIKIV